MKVLATGATGFVGKNLVPRLLKEGHDVTVFIRDSSKESYFAKIGAKVIIGDFHNKKALQAALENQEIVVHLVGTWRVWGMTSKEIDHHNVEPLRLIINTAPQSIKRIVFLSSVHVYDLTTKKNIDENSPLKPFNEYGASKLRAEQILINSGIPFTILRSGIIYGPGDQKGFIPNLLKNIKGSFVFLPGDGLNKFHPVFVDDVVDSIVLSVSSKSKSGIYNIVGPEYLTINDIINCIESLQNKKFIKIHLPIFLLKLAAFIFQLFKKKEPLITKDKIFITTASRTFSYKKAQKELNYNPKVKFREGMRLTLVHLAEAGLISRGLLGTNISIISRLAKSLPTPFFLFDENILIKNFKLLEESIRKNYPFFKIFYSAKTNYEIPILKALNQNGSFLEVACGHELFVAKKAGFRGHQICFDGPVKTDEDLEYAINEDVSIINSDSILEIERINRIASRYGKIVRVGLRVDLGISSFLKGPAEIMIKKFGISYKKAVEIFKQAKAYPNVILAGIHSHIGSQIESPDYFLKAIKKLVNLASELEREGIILQEINIGGGIPSPSLDKTGILNLVFSGILPDRGVPSIDVFGETISYSFAEEVKKLRYPLVLGLEPGRSISGPMGILISKVVYLKDNWVFLDASTYSLPESIFFARRKFIVLDKVIYLSRSKYNLAGASLNSADVFAFNEKLPQLERDDVVIIMDAGAYSISRSTQFTVLNPPVYLLNREGKLFLIRRKGEYQDLLNQTIYPPAGPIEDFSSCSIFDL